MDLEPTQQDYPTTLQSPIGCPAEKDTIFACRRVKLLCVHQRPVAWAVGFRCYYCRRPHVFRFGLDDAIDIPHHRRSHCSGGSPLKGRNVQIIVYGLPDCLDLPPEGFFPITDRRSNLRPAGIHVPESTLRNWIVRGIGGHRLAAVRTQQGLFTSEQWLDEFFRATGRCDQPEEPPLTGREEVAQMLREFDEKGGLANGEKTIESCNQLSD